MRRIRSAAQDMRIHQANPQRPKSSAQSDVFHHVFRRRPSATNKIAQTHPALVHAHANVEHKQPFKDEYRNVTWHGIAARHYCLWVLPYRLLEKPTDD
jgi:hypothetical protein